MDLDSIVDLEKRYALELQICEFGQVPKQLFTSPHPQRMASSHGNKSQSFAKQNSLIGGSDDEEENHLVAYNQWKTNMRDLRMVCDFKV